MRNRFAATLALGVATLALASQAKINYRDESFELRGFAAFTADLVSGGIVFKGDGAPAEVHATKAGMVLSGRQVKGDAKRGPDKAFYVSALDVAGSARLSLAARAPDTGATTIESESLAYAGTATEGQVSFASAFQLESTTTGPMEGPAGTVAGQFNQKIAFAGAKGTIQLAMAGPRGMTLRTGDVAGPVTFAITRNETLVGAAAQTSTLNGKADSMSFDFTAESRVVLMHGSVRVEGAGPVVSGTLEAETMRIFLDESYNVMRVEITGNPATTRFRDQRPTVPPR